MDSHTDYGVHHGPGAEARMVGGDWPMLAIDLYDGGHLDICPAGWGGELTDEHERFADELVAAAEQYRDAIVGARLWADFDRLSAEARGWCDDCGFAHG